MTKYTRAQVRTAILAAANWIESRVGCYDFMNCYIPSSENEQGCALGWIGWHLQMPPNARIETVADIVRSVSDTCNSHLRFYNELTKLMGSNRWIDSPIDCAFALRLYVDSSYATAPKETS